MKLNAPTLCKRRLVITLAAMAGLALTAPAQAQGSYPNKPIRMIVPLAAGSAVDVAARLLGMCPAMSSTAVLMAWRMRPSATGSGTVSSRRVMACPLAQSQYAGGHHVQCRAAHA